MTAGLERGTNTSRPLATVPEVAAHLALSRSKVYQLMDGGHLPYVKLGKCRRVRWEDVESLITQSRIGHP
jgi:excisionase family DNA binding protein